MDRTRIRQAIERELRRWDGIGSQAEVQAAAPRMAEALTRAALRVAPAKSATRAVASRRTAKPA